MQHDLLPQNSPLAQHGTAADFSTVTSVGQQSAASVEEAQTVSLLPGNESETGIGMKELECLARRFQHTSRLHRLRVRRAIWMGMISAVVLMVVNAAAMLVELQTERFAPAAMWWLWVLNAVVFAACLLYPARTAQARRRGAARLAQYEDVRAVGPLTELLTAADPALRRTARISLGRLLPRLTAEDARWLDEEQRDILCQALEDAERQPELAKAIVKAFAQVGDSRVIGQVQRIAEMRVRVSSHKELRVEARACLPLLRERIRQESARQTLLRAGSVYSADTDTLLRIPDRESLAPDGELLRPQE